MTCVNRQFGEITYDEQDIVTFPGGLIGREGSHKFLIIDDARFMPFSWLVSIQEDDLAVPLLDPAVFLPDYRLDSDNDRGKSVFVVALFEDEPEKSSVNLRSPILIDNNTRCGSHVILDNDLLPLRYPILPALQLAGER